MPGAPSSASQHRPEIVGERRQAGALRRRLRLDQRIGDEIRAGLLRFGQTEFAGRHRLDAIRRQQFAHLAQFARVMGGDDQLSAQTPRHSAIACFCKPTRG